MSQLTQAIRVRLRPDFGDTLVIAGESTPVDMSTAIGLSRVGEGLLAEVVVDHPQALITFPGGAWTGTREALLKLAWELTMAAEPPRYAEVPLSGLTRPLLAFGSAPPFATAVALNPCAVLDHLNGVPTLGALVAIPTRELVLAHFFMNRNYPNKTTIAARLHHLARLRYESCDESDRITPSVYFCEKGRPFHLERVVA